MHSQAIGSNSVQVTRHEIMQGENVARMSSLEIAELTEKTHAHVIRDIRTMLEALKDDPDLDHVEETKDARGYTSYFKLPKSLTLTLVSGYSVSVRYAIIKRWMELEDQQAPQVPQTLSQALRLAADQADLIEQQAAALQLAAPKVEFVERYVESTGSIGFRQLAKLLSANERRLRQLLLDKGVMYYLGGVLTPYAQHTDAGRFEVKTGTCEHNSHAFTQAKFTPKGVQYVAGLWAAESMKWAA
ncbi:phage antirepressor KilAC domain-containing protein [Ectopseudomonas mendocina]|uniref:Phage antirepressor KilAC domain-containing protein n=1 Tax=Ectopseudomonas mendocina TaxID=300 RepID=A0ABZ2RA90_ECTME